MTGFLRSKSCAIGAAIALALAMAPIEGQTAATNTCTTAPAGVTSFSIERVLTLTDVLTTYPPSIPANIIASIISGAQEIRERLIYNPQANTLTSTVFLVAPGSPDPTPIAVDITGTTLVTYTISIDRIYNSCKPYPSVMFVGTVSSSTGGPATQTGVYSFSFIGVPAVVSIGYTTDTPPKINNVVELFAGIVVSFAAAGNGTVTFPSVPVTPPGTTGPVIVLNITVPQTGRLQVFNAPFHLDASHSTDSSGSVLTYQWSVNPPVAFSPGPTAPAIDIQFPGQGDYTVMLTVTNGSGQTSSVTIPLQFIGHP